MIKFKNRKDMELYFLLHPALILVFSDLVTYAQMKHNIDLTVTATVSTLDMDRKLNRKSPSHREHRAIDIRTKDIDAFIVDDLVSYINNKPEYENYKYMSTSGVKRLAYWHNANHGEHLHLSIHSRFAKEN